MQPVSPLRQSSSFPPSSLAPAPSGAANLAPVWSFGHVFDPPAGRRAVSPLARLDLLQMLRRRPPRPPLRTVCIYCGAAEGTNPAFMQQARDLGRLLAQQNIKVVYGGATNGLMGAVATAALAGGVHVTGVVPAGGELAGKEVVHSQLSSTVVVNNLAERKAMMMHLADAFIVMPGGFGTLDELFDTLNVVAKGRYNKPIGFLNVDHYYTPLLTYLRSLARQGFVHAEDLNLFCSGDNPPALLTALRAP